MLYYLVSLFRTLAVKVTFGLIENNIVLFRTDESVQNWRNTKQTSLLREAQRKYYRNI